MILGTKDKQRFADLEVRAEQLEHELNQSLKSKIVPRKVQFAFGFDADWRDEDRAALSVFINSSTGVRMMRWLSQAVVNTSMSMSPITERKDGVRQGVCLTLSGIRSMAELPREKVVSENYDPLNFEAVE